MPSNTLRAWRCWNAPKVRAEDRGRIPAVPFLPHSSTPSRGLHPLALCGPAEMPCSPSAQVLAGASGTVEPVTVALPVADRRSLRYEPRPKGRSVFAEWAVARVCGNRPQQVSSVRRAQRRDAQRTRLKIRRVESHLRSIRLAVADEHDAGLLWAVDCGGPTRLIDGSLSSRLAAAGGLSCRD